MQRFMRFSAVALGLVLLTVGCDEGDAAEPMCGLDLPERSLSFCAGETAQIYDPVTLTSSSLAVFDSFPDDLLTRADPESVTGLRLTTDAASLPRVIDVPEEYSSVITDLSLLDGWGTTAGLYLRFDGPVAEPPSGLPASLTSPALVLAALQDGKATRVPYEARLLDDETTLLVEPMVPLKPATRHVLVVTRAYLAAGGGCIAPAAVLRGLLERRSKLPQGCTMSRRYHEALAAVEVAAEDVAAATVFTSQSIVERSELVANDVASRTFSWKEGVKCGPAGPIYRECEGSFSAADYRVVRPAPASQHGPALWLPPAGAIAPTGWFDHAVRVWLPPTGEGPWPVVIFGHGLGSNRGQGKRLAEVAAPLGFATVAIDAVRHGQHPLGGATSTITSLTAFFGISLNPFGFDFISLRDNWRQSTWDKLQLLALLRQAPDMDGDGQADVDPKRMGYIGVSLGGIMGPELLSLTLHLGFAVLSVAGGKVTAIIEHGEELGGIVTLLKPKSATKGDIARFFPALQTLLEKGDAANWGPRVLQDRLAAGGDKPPSVLMQMAIDDEIVPNVATRLLARAMGITLAGPVLQPIGLVPLAPKLPLAGNLADGGTAALFQFDRTTDSAGQPPEKANHSSTPASLEAMAQDGRFIETWLAGEPVEVIDPYALLKTPAVTP